MDILVIVKDSEIENIVIDLLWSYWTFLSETSLSRLSSNFSVIFIFKTSFSLQKALFLLVRVYMDTITVIFLLKKVILAA